MAKANTNYNNEIDLFEVLKLLWKEKFIIISFFVLAFLFGLILQIYQKKTPSYQSKMFFYSTNPPPYSNDKKIILKDFKKMFYTEEIFNDWKKDNKNISLIFNDFALTEKIDGVTISKDQDEQLATMLKVSGQDFLLIKTNKLSLLNDFFKYSIYVHNLLKSNYVLRAKEEIKALETRFTEPTPKHNFVVNELVLIDRYILNVKKSGNILDIHPPTMPKEILSKSKPILEIFSILGIMFGIIFVLVRNLIHKNKT